MIIEIIKSLKLNMYSNILGIGEKMKRRITYYLIGTIILALGISFSVRAELGIGPYDALCGNFSELIGVRIGVAMNIVLTILLLIQLSLRPSYKYFIGTILSMLVGVLVDIFIPILPVTLSFWTSLGYFSLALIFIPLGVGTLIRTNVPISPIESLVLVVTDILDKKYSHVKTSIEGIYVITGLICGYFASIGTGYIQVGTIFIMLYIGPAIQISLNLIKPIENSTI